MAEFNPYKLEEEKWTPKNVYEILPPNAVSWSDYDFGQGTDNVDQEAASKSFVDGFVDFFGELLGTAGQILGGALELGGAIFSGFVNGVTNLIGGIANAIGSIFGGGSGESPDLPLFNPIKTNLEAAIKPHRDKIDESWQKTEEILAQQEILVGQMEVSLEDMREASRKSKEASDRAGEAIGRAEAASAAAREARETLEEYNEALTKQITTEFNAAVGRADTAVSKAETLAGELADFKAQHQLEIDDAVGKAEQAVADLATLTPQVESALAESSAANQKVADLTPKVSDAVSKAGAAVSKADQTLADYTAWAAAQKSRIDSAVSKAEAATANLATLTPKVTDAVSKANKAAADVSTLTPKVTDAAAKAAKAATDVSNLTPKVTAAQNKADKAASDLSTLTPKVTAAQSKADSAYAEAEKVRTEVAPQIEDAQTKGESALAVADKAVDWLRNPNEIGASLIAIDPETQKPNWAEPLDPVTAEENPLNLPNAYKTGDYYYRNPRSMTVNVDPSTEYMVSLWVKADKPGSDMTYDLRNQDGDLAFATSRPVDGFLNAGDAGRAYWIKNVPTEWTQYKKIVTPREESRTVRFGATYFKHPSGDTQDVVQYIADLQIYPLVPSQADVDQAQNDAIRANQDILRQQEEINEAQRVANLANNAFIDNQTKWNLASTNATKALADAAQAQKNINAEQTKFNNFQTQFNKDQIKWNAAVDRSLETQKTVNDNFNEWTAGAATAIEANTTAIKALSKIDTGESLIAYLTPTDAEVKAGTAKYDVPVWTTATQKQLASNHSVVEALPARRKGVYGVEAGYGNHRANTVPVKVRPNTKYLWSFWSWGSGDLVIYMYGDGGYPVRRTRQLKVNQETLQIEQDAEGRRIYDPAENGNSHKTAGTQWLLSGFDFGAHGQWNYHTYEVEFTESTTEVWFDTFYWNWQTPSTGGQYFADMQFYPDIPTQASVDAAQNKALEAYGLFMDNQDEWNAGVEAALETQETVDKNFKKWTDGAAEAITANTRALAIINAGKQGSNIIPVNPDTGRPWFAEPLKESTDHPPLTSGPTYMSPAAQTSVLTHGPKVEVDPKIRYTLSFWAKASKAGSVFFGQFRSQEGRTVTPTGESLTKGGVTVANPPQPSNKDSNGNYVHDAQNNSYFVSNLKLRTTWTYYETEIQFNEGVTSVSISRMYWSHSNGIKADQYISGLSIRPQIPTQASVDKAQNDAISANTEALRALGKKVLGASLVPYKTPSTQEVEDYAAGKLSYDPWADPEYFDAGYSIASNSTYGRYARANSSQGTNSYDGTLVSVDSSIEYRIKFDAYAAAEGSILVVHMQDQDGNSAVQSTSVRDDGQMISSIYLVDYLALKKGWNSYSGKIKFKPSTTSASLSTFYWNHPNGVSTTQCLTNLEIVPDIPDANVVNLLQEEAILENTRIGKENNTAIKALESGLDAAIELGDANIQIEALEIELSKEAEKREALQRKVDDLQNEMIPRTIVSDDRVLYDDYVTLSGTKITAKTGWSGQMAVTYIERTGYGSSSNPYVYKTRVTRKSVPDGTTREWSFPSGIERVDYWVYQGRPRTILLANAGPYITGKTFSSGTWGVLATHKVGKTYGTGTIEWRANLQYADRGVTYRFKIEVNGKEVKNAYWKNIGPLTPLGSGKKTLRFEHEFSLPDDATVRVLGYAYNSNSQQARVSLLQGTLHYTQDTAREG